MYVCNPKGLGGLHVCRNLLYTPLESAFTGESLTIPDFVRGSFLRQFRIYTPLESAFTGESLTIPDFVRGTTFHRIQRIPLLFGECENVGDSRKWTLSLKA
jgi:hypothetical protein